MPIFLDASSVTHLRDKAGQTDFSLHSLLDINIKVNYIK